jgi:hypothetical protein
LKKKKLASFFPLQNMPFSLAKNHRIELICKMVAKQGDQIGRIFAQWAIAYFGQVF